MRAGLEVKKSFPLLADSSLVYLDSAASAQKPQEVIDAMTSCYETCYANVHRGVYALSARLTQAYESSRAKVRDFIGAKSCEEIIFNHGTTEGINMVAYSWGMANIRQGDEIVLSVLEHHSNFVPWQLLAERVGARLRFVSPSEDGLVRRENFSDAITGKTKLVAIAGISNSVGILFPIRDVVELAHEVGAKVLLDAAQFIPHQRLDVRGLDVDFAAFSGHKLYGPTGVGVLYGKKEILESMPPFLSGGEMIRSVSLERTTFADLPSKFEAGTPNIAGVIGLHAAISFVEGLGYKEIGEHEDYLIQFAEHELSEIKGVGLVGPRDFGHRKGLISFVCDGVHPHDVAQFLDSKGIAVRAGHHCAQPAMTYFRVPATVRASFGVYNTKEDVLRLKGALEECFAFFA